MATHSTVLATEDAIVAALDSALTVPFTFAWPGKSTEPICAFLGVHPGVADIVLDASGEDPVMKAGRRQRQEEYDVTITIWAFRPELSTADAREASVSAWSAFDDIDDVFRNDSDLGVDGVQHMVITDYQRRLFPFNSGWACEIRVTVNVKARIS